MIQLIIIGMFVMSFQQKQIYKSDDIQFHVSSKLNYSIAEIPVNTTILFKVNLFIKELNLQNIVEVLPVSILYSENQSKLQYYIGKKDDGIIDFDAIITGSKVHYLQFYKSQNTTTERLFLLSGDAQQQYIQFTLSYSVQTYEGQINCVNNCSSNGKCNKYNTCSCQYSYFGSYCELKRENVIFTNNMEIKIRPYQWKYFAIPLQSMETENLYMEISELKSELKISFGYNGIDKYEIPSLHQEVFQLIPDKKEAYEIYSLITQVAKYKYEINSKKILKDQILYVGLYNFNIYNVNLEILFRDKEQTKFEIFLRRNYIFLIILATNIFIAFTFLCFQSHFNEDDQERIQTTQESTQQIRVRRQIRRKRPQGFDEQFILDHFPPYHYNQIVLNYPALNEIQECVICMEDMTENNGKQEESSKAKDQQDEDDQLQQEENKGLCSVTPCYHMFHHHCLKKWFMTQKYCPVCRETYSEQQVQQMKKWLAFSLQSMTNKNQETFRKSSQYVQRMKQNKTMMSAENSFAGNSQIQLKQGIQYDNSISQIELSMQTQNEERKRQSAAKMNTESSPIKQ